MANPIPSMSPQEAIRRAQEIVNRSEAGVVHEVRFTPADDKIKRLEVRQAFIDEASRGGYLFVPLDRDAQGEVSGYKLLAARVRSGPAPASNPQIPQIGRRIIRPEGNPPRVENVVRHNPPAEGIRGEEGVESEESQPGREESVDQSEPSTSNDQPGRPRRDSDS